MNKNGFIATSLIYSFFLIFVTLFLTIIADYLQNKVLLNTIEKGIKDELNNTMSIEDFEVGDIVFFGDNIEIDSINYSNSTWIVANTIYDYSIDKNHQLILYSYETNYDTDCITNTNIIDDLRLTNDLNDTRLNELFYTFDGSDFSLDINGIYYKITKDSGCVTINNNNLNFIDADGNGSLDCEIGSNSNCRQRRVPIVGTKKFTITKSEIDSSSITISGVAS